MSTENIKRIMSGCMQADKPLISILMAVYEPRLDWLKEQLDSLEAQTYPNLRLYVRDDCSSTVRYSQIENCLRDCIRSFPYRIERNEKNLGSNKTFERLTREAKGDYFAYCDQDDIWLPEKLSVLQSEITIAGALLVCSDMYIMDETGKKKANSIREVRKHHKFKNGTGLASGLLIHNFVTGCTMLLNADTARLAIPFCPYMVHDHYLALWCAEHGRILSISTPLIRYRIHQSSQTRLLAGVTDKQSYGEIRIDWLLMRLQWLERNFPCGETLKKTLGESIVWADARAKNWKHHGNKKTIWKYRKFSFIPSVFELFAERLPESVFRVFLEFGKRNLI